MTQSKTGATKVKMRADHYYMLHRYQEAFDIAQEYCELVRTGGLSVSQGQNDGGFRRIDAVGGAAATDTVLKVSDPKEMQEMALRCALKLNLFDVAATLADELVKYFVGNEEVRPFPESSVEERKHGVQLILTSFTSCWELFL
jgi:hypothetical protein